MCPKKEKATDYQWLLSGWQDSNLRPPAPKAGAITGLRYTPNWLSLILEFSLNTQNRGANI